MNKLKKIIINRISFCFLLALIIVFLCGCQKTQTPEENAQKTTKELEYFEDKIFSILLKLEKNEYRDDINDLNWDDILTDAKKIDAELDNVIIDLSNLKVTNDEISKLSLYNNNVLTQIINENENGLINELTLLYEQIPIFIKEFESNKQNLIMKKELKSLVLKNFNNVIQGNIDLIDEELENIENKYNYMISNNDYLKENSFNINKIYILIQEYKTAVKSSNIEIIKIKFINLIEEL